MKGVGSLKERIVKLNFLSIFSIIILFSILSFTFVYFIIETSLKKEIEFIQNDYLYTRKTIVKNEVYNLINYINQISKIENKKYLHKLKESVIFLSNVLKKENPSNFKYVLSEFAKKHPFFIVALSDLNGNKIFANFKDYNKTKRKKFINEILSGKIVNNGFLTLNTPEGTIYASSRIFTNIFDGKKYFITNAVLKSTIDKNIQSAIANLLNTVNSLFSNSHVTIVKITTKNPGEYGKFIVNALDKNLNGSFVDSKKNFEYLREYIKNISKENEKYLIYKYKNKTCIAFIAKYKPFNWLIIDSLDISKIKEIVKKRKELIKKEIFNIFVMYIVISVIFLILVYFITKYENNLLSIIVDKYEKRIHFKSEKLQELNKNLQKEIDKKTQELVRSFFTDPLTGLPNREKLLVDVDNHRYVAILNIDSFKEINDFYGLDLGDEVLKKVAEILKKLDLGYKLPADEFAIIGDDLEELKERVKKIIEEVEKQKIKVDGSVEVEISMSAGIGENLPQADMALKFVKTNKNSNVNIMVYNDHLPIVKEYHNNIKWKNILKKVIKEDGVIPYVQPIVNASDYKTEKYECLIRIEYEGEIYPPYHFLEISKKTGQYIDLQKIMIDKCFKTFKDLDYKFSINLSAFELANEQFREYLITKIDEYNVADKLIIELLEDEKLHNEELMGFLIFLHNLDVEFAIDDFGSGHSNLSYLLSKLPVSILKIDGYLIKNINENLNNYKLVKALVNMAKIFNLSVVAEFVENEEIALILKDLGVDYLQGYYFSKPVPLDNLKNKL